MLNPEALSISTRKASVWYMDFGVGLLLFIIGTSIFFSFTNESIVQDDDQLNNMISSLKFASSSLMTRGYPEDWNSTTVKKIGLTDGNNRIIAQKVSRFANLDSDKVKYAFNSAYKYEICFRDENNDLVEINGLSCIGEPSENSTYQVTVQRLVIYDDSIVKMGVSFWQ